jgi:DNA-binding XRE family transcriptional regulator
VAILRKKTTRNEIRRAFYDELGKGGKPLPEAVKTLRKILAYDQDQFAAYVGISVSALRRIEQNKDNVKLSTIAKVLDKFRLRLMVLSRTDK